MGDKNQKLLFGVLMTLWLFAFAYQYFSSEKPERVPLTYTSGKANVKTKPQMREGQTLSVRIDLLTQKHELRITQPKDIFAPLHHPVFRPDLNSPPLPVPVPAPVPFTFPPLPPSPTPEEIAAEQSRQAKERSRQEINQFRYLGYLSSGGTARVMISYQNQLYMVKQGEVITGTFMLKELNNNSLIIQDTATQVEQSIALSESQ